MESSSGKSEMELIRNKIQTYVKRIKGLQKKFYEFSKLVNVDACMIVYGPKQGNYRPPLPDTYPENLRDTARIVSRYLSLPKQERTKRHTILSGDDHNNDGKNKIAEADDDSSKDSDGSAEAGDDGFDKLSADELQQLIDSVESKIDTIDEKIQFMEDAKIVTSRNNSNHDQVRATAAAAASGMQMKPPYAVRPFSQNYLYDHRRPPMNMNMVNRPGMVPRMAMNRFDPRNYSNNGGVPMLMQYQMMAYPQPGGGYQMEFGNRQGPFACYGPPQYFVQPPPSTSSSYIPNLMPGCARSDA